jgi:hypothetical protein
VAAQLVASRVALSSVELVYDAIHAHSALALTLVLVACFEMQFFFSIIVATD